MVVECPLLMFTGSVFTALGIGGGSHGKGNKSTGVAAGEGSGAGDQGTADGVQGCPLQRMSIPDLRTLVTRGMTVYEREEKALNILLFSEIFDHLVRIDRVLSVEGGALLLVGRSGDCHVEWMPGWAVQG